MRIAIDFVMIVFAYYLTYFMFSLSRITPVVIDTTSVRAKVASYNNIVLIRKNRFLDYYFFCFFACVFGVMLQSCAYPNMFGMNEIIFVVLYPIILSMATVTAMNRNLENYAYNEIFMKASMYFEFV